VADRPTYPITWGGGLDRASGIGVVQPASWADLRNVLLYDGKAEVRKGMEEIATLVASAIPQTDVLAMKPFRQRESLIIVAWDQATRLVSVFEAASNGRNPVLVDDWFTAEAAIGVPRFQLAESYGRMFLAHEFQYVRPGAIYLRATTQVYDGSTLAALTADLDRDASAGDVRFRWVAGYLNYMMGGGYGTDSDEDRGEIIRVSRAGNPTLWEPEHYFVTGKRGDPAIVGLPGPRSFLVFKDAQTYEIVGASPRTFGQLGPIDPLHGCPGGGLAITWGGYTWFWSYDGPRVTQGGGPSTPLDLPLDLQAPEPADLAEAGDLAQGFVEWDPKGRKLDWCFPTDAADITRVYSTHLRNWPNRIAWSYDEIQRRVRCAAVLYPVAQEAPPGLPQLKARGVLTFGANAGDGKIVTIDGKDYTFETVLTNVDGHVLIGGSASASLDNLIAAITLGAGSGTAYAAATTLHPTVTAQAGVGDTMIATAKDQGTAGNSIDTTTDVVSATWSAATLTGGAAGVTAITATGFTLDWNNVSALGDEITEVWLKNVTDAGDWTKSTEYPYESAAMQKVLNDVLEAEDDYLIALRHRRGSLYNAGAEVMADPTAWPLASQEDFAAAAVGSQPADFELHDTLYELYGGKEYIRHEVQWGAPTDTARGWEIYENTSNDFGTAILGPSGKNHVVSDPQSGLVTRTCDTGGCVTTDLLVKLLDTAPVQDYYYWVVFVDGGTWTPGTGFGGTGARSPETALADNPITYQALP
jgi:hypothetical protein